MSEEKRNTQRYKISDEFRARLKQIGRRKKVRAVLLLNTSGGGAGRERRLSQNQRRKVADRIRRSAKPALGEIDRILEQHDGKRLASEATALGSIPIETTVEGILALSSSELVKAVLEDQKITLPSKQS